MNVADVSGMFFIDTNVLVYTFDRDDPEKQAAAQELLVMALRTGRGMISSQVVQEFLNVAMRQFAQPLTVSESRELLRALLIPLCRHYPTSEFYDRALLIREETGFSLYDALIVTAAIELECSTLFSEDLQVGRKIGGLRIANPFAAT
jgi:predicted nucleic acid-binding protein